MQGGTAAGSHKIPFGFLVVFFVCLFFFCLSVCCLFVWGRLWGFFVGKVKGTDWKKYFK